jgi:hypothetical protein
VEETKILEEIYPKVKPFYANKELLLSKRKDSKVLMVILKRHLLIIKIVLCHFDGKTALCGIEQAYNQG